MRKVLTIATMCLIFIFFSLSQARGQNQVTVKINNKPLSFDVQPEIIQGHTMVPIRAIFEALGATVKWDPLAKTIHSTKNNIKIDLQINNKIATVNDEKVTLDVAPTIRQDRTMVPLRFISESLGTEINWDNLNKTAYLMRYSQLYLIKTETGWGYIDKSGKVVIEPVFEYATPFYEDVATIRQGKAWGYLQEKGKILAELKYFRVSNFHEGLGTVVTSNDIFYLNDQGEQERLTDKLGCAEIEYFQEGLAPVLIDGKWGYLDKSGNLVIKPQFAAVGHFSEGLAAANTKGKWGFIDSAGKYVIPPSFKGAGSFYEGLACIGLGDKFGFVDSKGRIAIPAIYDRPAAFKERLAAVHQGNKWGFIDHKGTTVIPFIYDDAGEFSEGMVQVKSGDKFGYIDHKGNWVIKPQFARADSFVEGLAFVQTDQREGYIDPTGKFIWEHKKM